MIHMDDASSSSAVQAAGLDSADALERARTYVRACLLRLNGSAPDETVDAVARKVVRALRL